MYVTTVLRQLSSRLVAAPSATRVLYAWCDEHHIGNGPILADKRHLAHTTGPDYELLDWLLPEREESIRHRRVTLTRGDVALSDCDLWWIPDRLATHMVAELDATATPFGTVISGLHPTRRTLFEALWPSGVPHVLEHRALVLSGVGMKRPVAAVRELYRRELIKGPTTPDRPRLIAAAKS